MDFVFWEGNYPSTAHVSRICVMGIIIRTVNCVG